MCEDRQEDEEKVKLSNSQIIHSVIDIFGAGESPRVMNVHNTVLLKVEQKNGFFSIYPELWACVKWFEAWRQIVTLGNKS